MIVYFLMLAALCIVMGEPSGAALALLIIALLLLVRALLFLMETADRIRTRWQHWRA